MRALAEAGLKSVEQRSVGLARLISARMPV